MNTTTNGVKTIADLLRGDVPALPETTPFPSPTAEASCLVGCALYLIGSVLINFGQIWIRLSHVTRERWSPTNPVPCADLS